MRSFHRRNKLLGLAICLALCLACLSGCEDVAAEEDSKPQTTAEETAIRDEDVVEACSEAVRELIQAPYFHLVLKSDNDPIETRIYRDGEDYLVSDYDGTVRVSSALKYQGVNGVAQAGAYVATEENQVNFGDLIGKTYDILAQENLEIKGVACESNSVIRIDGEWDEEVDGLATGIQGSFTYEFSADGSLSSVLVVKNRETGEASEKTGSYSLELEHPQATLEEIREEILSAAQQMVNPGQPGGEPGDAETLAVPPSNETEFDLQFLLGCDEMKWSFFADGWAFALRGEEATSEGITLVHQPASETAGVVLEHGGEYFLESWDGEYWNLLLRGTIPSNGPEENLVFGGNSLTEPVPVPLSWGGEYGALEEGKYRVGMYYTAARPSGEKDTALCYAKFLVRSAENDRLVQQCMAALEEILERDTYHIERTYYMPKQRENEDSYYYVADVWKSGADYYMETNYYSYQSGEIKNSIGTLLSNGKGYCCNSLQSPEKLWQEDGEVTERDFQRKLSELECTGKTLEKVTQKENSIQFDFSYPSGLPGSDPAQGERLTYYFDPEGKLVRLTLEYLHGDEETRMETELIVQNDDQKSAEEVIRGQNPPS